MLRDGSLLYGCTCNMSLSTAALRGLAFDTSFSSAAFEARARCGRVRVPSLCWRRCRALAARHAGPFGRRAGGCGAGHACVR